MKKFLMVVALALASCAAWDYTTAQQDCVDKHIGDPVGREQCICDTAHAAGRSCDFLGLDAGAKE